VFLPRKEHLRRSGVGSPSKGQACESRWEWTLGIEAAEWEWHRCGGVADGDSRDCGLYRKTSSWLEVPNLHHERWDRTQSFLFLPWCCSGLDQACLHSHALAPSCACPRRGDSGYCDRTVCDHWLYRMPSRHLHGPRLLWPVDEGGRTVAAGCRCQKSAMLGRRHRSHSTHCESRRFVVAAFARRGAGWAIWEEQDSRCRRTRFLRDCWVEGRRDRCQPSFSPRRISRAVRGRIGLRWQPESSGTSP
jgi:hypothetical protein